MEKINYLVKDIISILEHYYFCYDELDFLYSFISYCSIGDYGSAIDLFKDFLVSIDSCYSIDSHFDFERALFL